MFMRNWVDSSFGRRSGGFCEEERLIHEFLGRRPQFDESNWIAPSADLIGDVALGRETSIWFQACLRGDVNWIRIGAASNIQDGAVVHVSRGTAPSRIGDQVTVGHGAVIHGCTIRDRVLVGIGADRKSVV